MSDHRGYDAEAYKGEQRECPKCGNEFPKSGWGVHVRSCSGGKCDDPSDQDDDGVMQCVKCGDYYPIQTWPQHMRNCYGKNSTDTDTNKDN